MANERVTPTYEVSSMYRLPHRDAQLNEQVLISLRDLVAKRFRLAIHSQRDTGLPYIAGLGARLDGLVEHEFKLRHGAQFPSLLCIISMNLANGTEYMTDDAGEVVLDVLRVDGSVARDPKIRAFTVKGQVEASELSRKMTRLGEYMSEEIPDILDKIQNRLQGEQ
ncbi:MAG: hypothetical protein AAF413_01975 [Patescibacteria group bacterium]